MRLGLQLGYDDPVFWTGLAEEAERCGVHSVWTSEAYGSDAIGPLACEPAWVTDAALEVIPSDRRADPHLQALLRRLDAWRSRPSEPAVGLKRTLRRRTLDG